MSSEQRTVSKFNLTVEQHNKIKQYILLHYLTLDGTEELWELLHELCEAAYKEGLAAYSTPNSKLT